MITCGTQVVAGSNGGGGASLPATPADALLNAGSPSTVLGLNASGVGEALSASAARSRIDAQQDVFTTRGDLVRAGVSGVAERLALGTSSYVLTSDGTDAVKAAGGGGGGDATSIQGVAVDATAPTLGQVLTYDGSEYIPTTPGGGTPTWLALYGGSAFYMGGESTTGWLAADYVTASAAAAVPAFGPGQSLVVCLFPNATPTGVEMIAAHNSAGGSRGWYIAVGGNAGARRQVRLYLAGLASSAEVALTGSDWTNGSAYVIAICIKADKSVRYSVNGGAVQTLAALTGTYTVPTSADTFDVGSTRAYSPSFYPLVSALIGEVRTYSTEISDADLVAACAGVATGTIPTVATGTASTRFLPSDFCGGLRVKAQTGVTWVVKGGASIRPV